MERSEVKEEYKWSIEDIFPSEEAWEREYEAISSKIDFSEWQGKLGTAENLLAFLKEQDEMEAIFSKLYVYAMMKQNEDARIPEGNVRLAKMGAFGAKFGAALAFVEPELLSLPEETLQSFIDDPAFRDYDYQLKSLLKSKPHVLSEAEEKLLAMSSEVTGSFQNIFSMIDNADLDLPEIEYKGETVRLTHGLYGKILGEEDRAKRKEVFEKYYAAYSKLKNTIAANYFASVKASVFGARARKYSSCLAKALENNDVDPVVYQNLMDSVNENVSVMHDYINYRKEALGLEEQHMYDIYAPLVEGANLSMSYEESYDLVVKALSCLGEDYQELLRRAKRERWIDVEETTAKRSGAYSINCHGVHPFVLLNYQPTLSNIFTTAHEMGHALHSYFSEANQPISKASYRTFVAEVASTVNETLLLRYLLKTTEDKKIKKYLLNYHLDQLRSTLFRQTEFAMFEYEAHKMVEEGNPLTTQNLYELYYGLNRKIYGDGIVHDSEIGYEWSRIPHFYRPFYVYQYSTGIISAISIANRILGEGAPAVADYKKFLSAGGSLPPVEILKLAGVDLTSKEPFRVAMQDFADTLKELKELD